MAEHLETGLRQNDDGSMVPQRIASKIVSASMINQDNKIQSIGQLHKPVIITFLMEVCKFGQVFNLAFVSKWTYRKKVTKITVNDKSLLGYKPIIPLTADKQRCRRNK